jgi:hypothetical protein
VLGEPSVQNRTATMAKVQQTQEGGESHSGVCRVSTCDVAATGVRTQRLHHMTLGPSECRAKIRLAMMSSAVMVVTPLPTTPTKAHAFRHYAC